MDDCRRPVLVVFELDFSSLQFVEAWETIYSVGILPVPKVCLNTRSDGFESLKMMEVWPSSDCEAAFLSNILPDIERAGVNVSYKIYPIRPLMSREIDVDYHASRMMLYN